LISITKLLSGREYFGDSLRYSRESKGGLHGSNQEAGPVVVWNITRSCNLHCMHCYMDSDIWRYSNELSTEEAKSFIDGLSDFHVPVLLLSGGEPLLRPDFFELARYTAEKGIRPTLSTNGTLITGEIARQIKTIGIGYVGISLDGLREVNDKFRGKEGAFQDAMNGIDNCVAANQRVGLRFTINRYNYQELDRIFDFIEERSIDRACFYHLVYTGRGRGMFDDDLSFEEKREAMDTIIRRTEDFEERGLDKEILTVDNHCDGVYLYLCMLNKDPKRAEEIKNLLGINGGNRSGIAFGQVDPWGDVHSDQFTRHIKLGNIRERKFSDIWTDMSHPILAGLRDRKPLLKGRCSQCQYLSFCNGNFRARAEAVTGDFWESDPACYLTDQEIGV